MSFWKGFEKQAFLKGYLPKKLFEKAVNKKFRNDLARSGANIIEGKSIPEGLKEIVSEGVSLIKNKSGDPSKLKNSVMKMNPGMQSGSDVVFNPHTFHAVAAKGLDKLKKTPPTLGAQVGTHELNELRYGKGLKPKDYFVPTKKVLPGEVATSLLGELNRNFVKKAPVATEKILNKIKSIDVPFLPSGIKEKIKLIQKDIDPKKVKNTVREGLNLAKDHPEFRAALKGRQLTGTHASPGVLIEESNKLFHEADDAAKKVMTHARKTTGEHDIMRRHGLRYGEEYIQPGTRRFNKLMKNMRKDKDVV